MRHNDLTQDEFIEVMAKVWAFFVLQTEEAKKACLGPLLMVVAPRLQAVAVHEIERHQIHGAMTTIMRMKEPTVPVLCMEAWVAKMKTLDERDPTKSVREIPGRMSAVTLVAQFEDGAVMITGELSHDEPPPGGERTITFVEAHGCTPNQISGRMVPTFGLVGYA